MHAGSSPERVGPAQVPYQLTYFGSDAWSSGPTPSALPSPISSEPTTVPADDRLRFHDDEDALPVSPDSAQQHPKPAVGLREPRPFHGTAEDGELLAKSDSVSFDDARVLVGSNHPIQVDPPSWRARALTPFTRAYLGETVVQEVIRTLGLVNENLERSMAEEKLNRDLFPRDEFLSPR